MGSMHALRWRECKLVLKPKELEQAACGTEARATGGIAELRSGAAGEARCNSLRFSWELDLQARATRVSSWSASQTSSERCTQLHDGTETASQLCRRA